MISADEESLSGAAQIYKSKSFARQARKEGIADDRLCEAIRRAQSGQIDTDYGGGVIKQRIARPNEGKSGGYRAIVFFKRGGRAFFAYVFPKSARDNIDESEEKDFKMLATALFAASDAQIAALVARGAYIRVKEGEVRCAKATRMK
jgi:hypothetical protein